MNRSLIILLISSSFFSCRTELDLDDVFEKKTIIEGYIIKNEKARVRISESVSKTSPNNFPSIENAIITLQSENQTEQLVHVGQGIYESTIITGTPSNTYEIEVQIEDDIYRAKSTMPDQSIWIDSIGFKQEINFDTSDYVTFLDIFAFPHDNPNSEDFGFFTLRIDGNLAFDARVFFDENTTLDCPYFWEARNVLKGSNLEVELIQMEPELFDYFFELKKLNDQINFVGLSVAPPANIKGNFDNDVLGYFGALNTDKKTRILGN